MDADERIVFRLGGPLDEGESSLLWGAATFCHVTFRAGANHIFPIRFSAGTTRDNVVKGKLSGGETFATILAGVSVAGEDVPPIEFYLASGQAVVEQEADNAGDGDVEIYGRNPVLAIRLEITFELAYLAPVLEIVVCISTLLKRDYLSKLAKEQRKCPPGTDYANSHIVLVQDKDITVQAGFKL
jgi:hypothetical protein